MASSYESRGSEEKISTQKISVSDHINGFQYTTDKSDSFVIDMESFSHGGANKETNPNSRITVSFLLKYFFQTISNMMLYFELHVYCSKIQFHACLKISVFIVEFLKQRKSLLKITRYHHAHDFTIISIYQKYLSKNSYLQLVYFFSLFPFFNGVDIYEFFLVFFIFC